MGNGSTSSSSSTKESSSKNIVVAKNIKNLVQINSKNFLKLKMSDIYENKGASYCDIEREDFKIGTEIMKKFEKFNSFSKEDDG